MRRSIFIWFTAALLMTNALGCGGDDSAKPAASIDDMYGVWEGMIYATWNDGRQSGDSLALFIYQYPEDYVRVYIGKEYHPSELMSLSATKITFTFQTWLGPYEIMITYCTGKRSGKIMTGTLYSPGYNEGDWYGTRKDF